MLALTSSMDPTAATMMAKATGMLAVSGCQGATCGPAKASPYRVSRSASDDPTSKDRAFAEDGSYCSVVGAARCTKRGRPVLVAPISYD